MPEPRFGSRPPAVTIIAEVGFTANDSDIFRGRVPPWVVLAGSGHVIYPNQLRFTHQLPAATFTISGTVEVETTPPSSSAIYKLYLFASGPFLPDRSALVQIPWPAGQASLKVQGHLSVPSGYNEWEWAQNVPIATNYRDFTWTVIA